MKSFYVLNILVLCLILFGCQHNAEIDRQLDEAESLMLSAPDSSLRIINHIPTENLSDTEQKARYALLKSMALDKNYIDTTTFDVLQPAIDYYLDHGTPDQKLRTLYYQGRIFMNKSDFDMAMQSFLMATDLKNECRDTLTFANMLVAQGNIYAESYQMEDYVENNLCASELYSKIREPRREFTGLMRALDGCITLGNKMKSDIILSRIDSLVKICPEFNEASLNVRMTYGIRFDSDSVIANIISSITDSNQLDDETKLDITLGYLKLHEPARAKSIFESIDPNSLKAKSFRYISVEPMVFEANKEYSKALDSYKKFQTIVESENSKIYSQKTTVAKELHELQINHLYSLQRKDRQIWFGLCTVLVLIIIICIAYYQLRLFKIKRVVAEKEQSRLQLENENLQKQNSVLELEKQTAELETEKQHLAGENMMLRISQLEAENEQLKVLSEKDELPDDVKAVIKERIGILNALFAANILDKEPAATAYVDLVKREISDKEKFMNSNRLAFKVSHPMFIKYFEEHGLTEYEINYLCLYAIGLKGKEVGNYMELRRHYNISSDIRRKLGIDEHETNIGIYVRKLLKQL
ncbi:hypothetical protein [Bacteroides caecimuris]|uniref:hypothetical protein n=1 Tax=Bacteroides caecimuris TaxID=1796613 RepID=UPI0026F2E159|nr:hypothetical protein [Bacteroides caecimuris]